MIRRAPILGALVALGLVASIRAAEAPAVAGAEASARVFEVRHRPLADAAELVEAVLSEDGRVTLNKRLRVLLVEDRTAVLDRVAALLESFDVPARDVEVTLSLYLGTKRKAAEDPARPTRGVVDLPPLQFTDWSDYRSLGSRAVRGSAGDEVTAELSEDYRVLFVIEWADDRLVKFERVSLQQVRRDAEGLETVKNVYSMGVTVSADRQTFVGTATGPDAEQALFLAVKARPR